MAAQSSVYPHPGPLPQAGEGEWCRLVDQVPRPARAIPSPAGGRREMVQACGSGGASGTGDPPPSGRGSGLGKWPPSPQFTLTPALSRRRERGNGAGLWIRCHVRRGRSPLPQAGEGGMVQACGSGGASGADDPLSLRERVRVRENGRTVLSLPSLRPSPAGGRGEMAQACGSGAASPVENTHSGAPDADCEGHFQPTTSGKSSPYSRT